ncbi:2-Hydroxyacid oxidase 2-like [Saccoglossus kowalevskii]|uniref:Hydroxyacid oxidase 1-like n=1 Tax=Saccoglossus kowalevskii TaxID=10224 RepID=A0ABM0M9B0_SACKO|nr:PREDICTED: hydroxyacid oxidase 1-like [Saccoglossus kowalevskii]
MYFEDCVFLLVCISVIVYIYRLFKKKEPRSQSSQLICCDDFEQYARDHVPADLFGYIAGGTGKRLTIPANIEAFKKVQLMTKIFHPVINVDLRTMFLGRVADLPIGIAPSSARSVIWPDGERCVARAADDMKIVSILPMLGSASIESIAKSAPSAVHWLQIRLCKDNAHMSLIHRAEDAGFEAIVVSADGARGLRCKQHKFPTKLNTECPNFNYKSVTTVLDQLIEPCVSWHDLDDVISETKLPVVLKGVLNPDDAIEAVKHGVQGIIVSNHGGRILDGVPSSLEMLPEIKSAIGDDVDLYFDSGIRTGSDVFKALALGAKGVFIGRPVLYGLSYQGEEGIKKVFNILTEELRIAMIHTGCSSISKISPAVIRK